jgi:hypothetical protein
MTEIVEQKSNLLIKIFPIHFTCLLYYGKADIPTMKYYKTKTSEMALDSRYILAASYLAVVTVRL